MMNTNSLMRGLALCAFLGALHAGLAQAKEGVTNPAVKARMDHMAQIKARLGALTDMAKGASPFDATGAESEAAALSALAIGIPQKFEPAETDPVSEAQPSIWQEFDAFSAKSDALYDKAQGIDAASAEALAASLQPVSAACKSCHDRYRK